MPSPAGPYDSLSGKYKHVCAIDSATKRAVCWGECPQKSWYSGCAHCNQHCEPPSGADTQFYALAASTEFTCGIRLADRQLECWGITQTLVAGSEVDKFTGGDRAIYLTVPPTHPTDGYSHIDVGWGQACAIEATSQRAVCWGDDKFGQATPPVDGTYKEIASGNRNSCGILANSGRLQCWGQSGDPFVAETSAAHAVTTGVLASFCALKDADSTILCSQNYWFLPPTGTAMRAVDVAYTHSVWATQMGVIGVAGDTNGYLASVPAALQ
jgi:hypothetical protein